MTATGYGLRATGLQLPHSSRRLTLAVLHILIDTRVPFRWWDKVFKKSENSPDYPILLIGCDQVLHICCIAGWIVLAPHLK